MVDVGTHNSAPPSAQGPGAPAGGGARRAATSEPSARDLIGAWLILGAIGVAVIVVAAIAPFVELADWLDRERGR